MDKNLISTKEAAEILGISTVAVWKRIQKRQIHAFKVGRAYVVDRRSLGNIYQEMSLDDKKRIDKAVDKVVKDYGTTLKRLGKE
jgi:excisionase family DNA binding protein